MKIYTNRPSELSFVTVTKPLVVLTPQNLGKIADEYHIPRQELHRCLELLQEGKDIIFLRRSRKEVTDSDPGSDAVRITGGLEFFGFVKEQVRSIS